MVTFNRKQNRFHPMLKNKRYKFLYVVLDIYLGIGVVSLLISILYLLLNLERADKILYYCVPGFVIFLSSAILYLIGYQTLIWNNKSKNTDL
jgi:uncharacterized membrane protein